MAKEPDLVPFHGCPEPKTPPTSVRWDGEPSKYGDLWPRFYCECPSCGRPYVWTGAHYESGLHYTCAPCGGFPFWTPDEADIVYHLDGEPAGYMGSRD